MFNIRTSIFIFFTLLAQTPALAQDKAQDKKYVPFDMPYVGAAFGRGELAECTDLSGESVAIIGIPNVSDETTIMALDGGVHVDRLPVANISRCQDDGGYRVYGGVDFNLHFVPVLLGIEGGYIDIGKNSGRGAVQGQYYTPQGTPNLNSLGDPIRYGYAIDDLQSELASVFYGLRFGIRLLDNRLILFGKGGFHDWEHQYGFTIGDPVPDETGLTPEQVAALPGLPAGGTKYSRVIDDRDIFYGLGVQYNFPQENGNVVGVRVDWDRFRAKGGPLDIEVDVYSMGLLYGFDIHNK